MIRKTKEETQVVIIGAGIMGCAVAYEISCLGFAPLVLEQGPRIAEGVTSRNSGVVHAGIYYPPNSLKAKSCIRGNKLLYEWCEKYKVPHRKTGKWIVGTKDEEGSLTNLYKNAIESGATNLEMATASRIAKETSGVVGEVAIFSSDSGIVDPYEYSRSLQVAAEQNGSQFILDAKVKGISVLPGGSFKLQTNRGEIDSDIVINCAGLHCDDISNLAGINKYKIYAYRGDYFYLANAHHKSLIYPVKKKDAPGLGIHLTIDLSGRCKLGPDVKYVEDKTDFGPPPNTEELRLQFFEATQKYLKNIRLEDLHYDSCGLRPKLRAPDEDKEKDFVISEDLPGFINLIGIESPGLTAARDLGQRTGNILGGRS